MFQPLYQADTSGSLISIPSPVKNPINLVSAFIKNSRQHKTQSSLLASFESEHRSDDVEGPKAKDLFEVHLATSQKLRAAADSLVRKRYSWRGYSVEDSPPCNANRITMAVQAGGQTVGTMTPCLDTGGGLPADENFRDQLDLLRARGHRLAEASRLAIDDGAPKKVFASLIHLAVIFAYDISDFTDWVIEVNPRHAVFYRRMLGFRQLCDERVCSRVNAPGVLLILEAEYMSRMAKKYGGMLDQCANTKSFYPYCFSPMDAMHVESKLRTAVSSLQDSTPHIEDASRARHSRIELFGGRQALSHSQWEASRLPT